MGALAPLYLAGLAALSLPLVLHLVRRTPRGRQPFSSLMFLTPSPPRVTRRSRLDQILLLLLRAAALALLAFAFARPFLRASATLPLGEGPSRRVAILLDTSASMQREDLWTQATARVQEELAELSPRDDVALYAFDATLRTMVPFAEAEGTDPAKANVIRTHLRKLRPTSQATDLGTALATMAGELAAADEEKLHQQEPLIVVVSDLQRGSRTAALQSFDWPKRVRVAMRQVVPDRPTNAFIQVLKREPSDEAGLVRVRVATTSDSTGDQFFVRWEGAADSSGKAPAPKKSSTAVTAVYVPPGQSRVVKLPRPVDDLAADRIVVHGDDHPFDNRFYVATPRQQDVIMAYIGDDSADDPQGMQYYLRAAVADDPLRKVTFRERQEWIAAPANGPRPQVVVVTGQLSAEERRLAESHVAAGGLLLFAPANAEAAKGAVGWFDDLALRESPPEAHSEKEGEFALLGQIDFEHPLFAPLAGPKYGDFTKIHFWGHHVLEQSAGGASRIVARFDNGDPAVVERAAAADTNKDSPTGRVWLLASGWRPDDSQLALSGKFVPLVQAVLDEACGRVDSDTTLTVGEPLPLPERQMPAVVQRQGGQQVHVRGGAEAFTATDAPGNYRLTAAGDELRFAVNLAVAESDTAPLDLAQLEQWGVKLGTSQTRAERIAQARQKRDIELESQQKLWRWLLAGMLGLIVVETWWAGRAARVALENPR